MSALDIAARSLEPGTLVKLFVLDLTAEAGPILRFHPYTNLVPNTIIFQGETYNPFPIADEGWDVNTKGTLPKPVVTVSNVGGLVSGLLRLYGDFVGCTITRKRTFAQFLDGAAEADPTAEFPPDVFTVDRRKLENNTVVGFELASNFDAEGVLLPRRQIIANFCQWIYRGADCTYAGAPVADDQDTLLSPTASLGLYNATVTYSMGDYVYVVFNGIRQYYVSLINSNTSPLTNPGAWVKDECAKKIQSCRLRFGGGTTTTGVLRSMTGIAIATLSGWSGTGYVVGNTADAIGGTFEQVASIRVTHLINVGGFDVVNGIAINNSGLYSAIPPNPVHFQGGGGTQIEVNVIWSSGTIVSGGAGILPTGAFPGAAKVVI
jgi:lambda family phage minor tail protein L